MKGSMKHIRNVAPMLTSPRCGAKTRRAQPVRRRPSREKNGVECMAVPVERAHLKVTETH
jgi:hypothetical protein